VFNANAWGLASFAAQWGKQAFCMRGPKVEPEGLLNWMVEDGSPGKPRVTNRLDERAGTLEKKSRRWKLIGRCE